VILASFVIPGKKATKYVKTPLSKLVKEKHHADWIVILGFLLIDAYKPHIGFFSGGTY